MPQRCLYEVLGIERTADDDVIKKAYRKQALVWHPGELLLPPAAADPPCWLPHKQLSSKVITTSSLYFCSFASSSSNTIQAGSGVTGLWLYSLPPSAALEQQRPKTAPLLPIAC
jgi:hypothetical protein